MWRMPKNDNIKSIFNVKKIILTVCVLVFLLSGIMLVRLKLQDRRGMEYWQHIAELKEMQGSWGGENILPEYQALYDENPDIVGWIAVEGTYIDYPVMQTKEDPEYYLRRNFDREDDHKGTPFADYRCDILPYQGFNTIIYGHNTSGDDMFRWLLNYQYRNWYHEHREIRFDTLKDKGIYEVFAVFYADVSGNMLMTDWDASKEDAYAFYNYINVDSEEGFRKYVDGLDAVRLYETDAELALDSHLITLVCCAPKEFSGIAENGRMVVVAVKK